MCDSKAMMGNFKQPPPRQNVDENALQTPMPKSNRFASSIQEQSSAQNASSRRTSLEPSQLKERQNKPSVPSKLNQERRASNPMTPQQKKESLMPPSTPRPPHTVLKTSNTTSKPVHSPSTTLQQVLKRVWWVDPRLPNQHEVVGWLKSLDAKVKQAKTADVDTIVTNFTKDYPDQKNAAGRSIKVLAHSQVKFLLTPIWQQNKPTFKETMQADKTHGPSTALGQGEKRYHHYGDNPYILAEDITGEKRPILNREWQKPGEGPQKPYPIIYWKNLHFGKCPFTYQDLPEDYDETEKQRLRESIEQIFQREGKKAEKRLRRIQLGIQGGVNHSPIEDQDMESLVASEATADPSGFRNSTTSRVPRGRDNIPPFRPNQMIVSILPKIKKKKSAVAAYQTKSGYCEHCTIRYDVYADHIATRQHEAKMTQADVWKELDALAAKVARPLRDKSRPYQEPQFVDPLDNRDYIPPRGLPSVFMARQVLEDESVMPSVVDVLVQPASPKDTSYVPRSRSPTRSEMMAHEVLPNTVNCSVQGLPGTEREPVSDVPVVRIEFVPLVDDVEMMVEWSDLGGLQEDVPLQQVYLVYGHDFVVPQKNVLLQDPYGTSSILWQHSELAMDVKEVKRSLVVTGKKMKDVMMGNEFQRNLVVVAKEMKDKELDVEWKVGQKRKRRDEVQGFKRRITVYPHMVSRGIGVEGDWNQPKFKEQATDTDWTVSSLLSNSPSTPKFGRHLQPAQYGNVRFTVFELMSEC